MGGGDHLYSRSSHVRLPPHNLIKDAHEIGKILMHLSSKIDPYAVTENVMTYALMRPLFHHSRLPCSSQNQSEFAFSLKNEAPAAAIEKTFSTFKKCKILSSTAPKRREPFDS
ncbi:hypothetical protein EVAR_43416_1 [Eumeta japonica]|uniref:Uncharacterized protein n=1 Tax=Eumeta variegata TaxID=151549 RepID=A0A4C1WWV8_EUMVA|nr:hypothetical protein EVAR_43416_1 [Eumeta japonica]